MQTFGRFTLWPGDSPLIPMAQDCVMFGSDWLIAIAVLWIDGIRY
ncbi:hypothetical protein SH139x_005337 [Planctomycetaceae bacterium SH139]